MFERKGKERKGNERNEFFIFSLRVERKIKGNK